MTRNLFSKPSPVIGTGLAELSFDDAMLIDSKLKTVPVGAGAQRAQSLYIPAKTFQRVGDTVLLEFYGRTVSGGGSPCLWTVQVNGGSFTMDGDDHTVANLNCSVDGEDKWRLVVVGTLCGNGLIKWQTFLDNFRNADGGTDQRQDYGTVYCFPDAATNIELQTDLDNSGANFEVTVAKAYYIANAFGLPNIGTPDNASFDGGGSNLTWNWDGTRPDPDQWWLLEAQRGDTGAWVNPDDITASPEARTIFIDTPWIAGRPALADAWNGKVRIVGINMAGFRVTNPSEPVQTF